MPLTGSQLLYFFKHHWHLAILGLALSVTGLFVVNTKVQAQLSTATPVILDDQVNAIASQLYCPVCENTPLDVCPTTVCARWRDQIRLMLGQGKSADEIKNYFVNYYGARVLAEPPDISFKLLLYLLLAVFTIIGGFLIFRTLRRPKQPVGDKSTPSIEKTPAQEEYLNIIEEELRRRS
jgi:cytochrome c-type biogenesis protein CcmH